MDGIYLFHLLTVAGEWGGCVALLKSTIPSFCFGGVQEQVVVHAPLGHMLERLLVTGLVVVANEPHHRRVISGCYHGVGGAGGDAVLVQIDI